MKMTGLTFQVTGVCECVGAVAPMLGGGHGLLQGKYGLLADQLINPRIVLGNGTAVTVSNTSHPDLFWAIRGAGHNFGIVTEYTYRIFAARPNERWGFEQFIFAGTQLGRLYTAVNKMKQSQPAEVVEWGFITRMPALDPVNVRIADVVWIFTDCGDWLARRYLHHYLRWPLLSRDRLCRSHSRSRSSSNRLKRSVLFDYPRPDRKRRKRDRLPEGRDAPPVPDLPGEIQRHSAAAGVRCLQRIDGPVAGVQQ